MIDSLSIIPESLMAKSIDDSVISISYNIQTGLVNIESPVKHDSLEICYQTFPYKLNQSYYIHSYNEYDSMAIFKDLSKPKVNTVFKREELFQTPELNKSGSLSRSISFGTVE